MDVCIFPKITFLLPSKSKHTILHSLSEECLCVPPPPQVGGSLQVKEVSFKWTPSGVEAPDLMAWTISPIILRKICMKLTTTWIICSSHLPYLVFIIKTCLLKYTFLLPNTWKIYDFCIAFYISVQNSMNTLVIFRVITEDFSSNLKLSPLSLILAVSVLSFLLPANNYSENV